MNPQFSNNQVFAQNNSTGRRTVFWFRMYCALMSLIYILCIGFGAFMAIAKPTNNKFDGETETLIAGIIYIVIGAVLLVAFAAGLVLPARRWTWIYNLVLIAIGMTSCCFLPITVPLLIYWLKPETKALFGR